MEPGVQRLHRRDAGSADGYGLDGAARFAPGGRGGPARGRHLGTGVRAELRGRMAGTRPAVMEGGCRTHRYATTGLVAPAWARRDCQSATKSIGCSSTGGKPPSRVTSDRMLRANGNRIRGHSTSSTGSIALSGRPVKVNTPA